MISKLTIAFLAVFLFAGNIFAEDMTPENVKKILKKARKKQENISYKCTKVIGTGKNKQTITIYNKVYPDGTSSYRYEAVYDKASSPAYLVIRNNFGSFQIMGKVAIKKLFKEGLSKKELAERERNATYSCKEGSYRGIHCYIVNQKITPSEEKYRNFMKFEIKNGEMSRAQLREIFEKNFPVLRIFYIGKKDEFIYKTTSFNIRGKKIGSFDRGIVILNPFLDDRLFLIPEDSTIKIAKTFKDFIKINTKIIVQKIKEKRRLSKGKQLVKQSNLGLWEKMSSYIDNNLNSISSILSKILFWGAMTLILVIVFLKIKQKIDLRE